MARNHDTDGHRIDNDGHRCCGHSDGHHWPLCGRHCLCLCSALYRFMVELNCKRFADDNCRLSCRKSSRLSLRMRISRVWNSDFYSTSISFDTVESSVQFSYSICVSRSLIRKIMTAALMHSSYVETFQFSADHIFSITNTQLQIYSNSTCSMPKCRNKLISKFLSDFKIWYRD